MIEDAILADITIDGISASDILKEGDFHWDFNGHFSFPSIQKKFISYCMKRKSPQIFFVISLFMILWGTLDAFFTCRWSSNDEICFTLLNFLILLVCLLATFMLRYYSTSNKYRESEWHPFSQLILILSLHCLVFLKLFHGSFYRKDFDFIGNFGPYVIYPSHLSLPPAFFSIQIANGMVLVPVLLMGILYDHRFYINFICCSLMFIGLVITNGFTAANIFTVTSRYSIVLILFHEMQCRRVKAFINYTFLIEMLAVRERNADAIHAMEMRHMIGNVAHDLKTPLSAFVSGVDLLKSIVEKTMTDCLSNGFIVEEVKNRCEIVIETVKNITNANSFMLMEINRCVDYTKASKGIPLVPKFEGVEAKKIILDAINVMKNIQEKVKIEVIDELSSIQEQSEEHNSSHLILTDKQWLYENVLCLLSNAVKYSRKGPVILKMKLLDRKPSDGVSTKTIDITCPSQKLEKGTVCPPIAEGDDEDGDADYSATTSDVSERKKSSDSDRYLLVEVVDDGERIPEDVIPSLFSPFKQAKRLVGGKGLGLYSLAKRVEQLEGNFGVRSRLEEEDVNASSKKQGSIFWFTIPYDPVVSSDFHRENSRSCSSSRTESFSLPSDDITSSIASQNNTINPVDSVRPLRILLVDDSLTILKLFSMTLKKQLNSEVITAENGAVAVQKIQEHGLGYFDCILMDIQMPVMDGTQATKQIREWESLQQSSNSMLIIGISANSDNETVQDAYQAGADEFLNKPFTIEVLKTVLQKHQVIFHIN